jgi:hypothetical protein
LEEIETRYGDVCYSAVRLLSRGAVLKRFLHVLFELDDKWILELAFLVDITYLND